MWQSVLVDQVDSSVYLTFVADSLLKVTVVLLAALAATGLLWRRSAAARHFVWASAVAGSLLVPVLSLFLPGWGPVREIAVSSPDDAHREMEPIEPGHALNGSELRLLAQLSSQATIVDASPIPDQQVHPTMADGLASGPLTPSRSPGKLQSWLKVGEVVWLLGAIVVLLPVLAGIVRVELVRRRSEPLRSSAWLNLLAEVASGLRLRRRVSLTQSSLGLTPLTAGVLRPFVLLPESSQQWDVGKRRIVLRHELAHIKRFDVLTQWVAKLACAVFWIHPLMWLAARQMRIERERACDDLVLAAGEKPTEYSQQLVEFAAQSVYPRWAATATLAMARPQELEDRLHRILNGQSERRPVSRLVMLAGTLIGIALTAGVASAGRVIVKDAKGNVVASVAIPDGGSATIDEKGRDARQGEATISKQVQADVQLRAVLAELLMKEWDGKADAKNNADVKDDSKTGIEPQNYIDEFIQKQVLEEKREQLEEAKRRRRVKSALDTMILLERDRAARGASKDSEPTAIEKHIEKHVRERLKALGAPDAKPSDKRRSQTKIEWLVDDQKEITAIQKLAKEIAEKAANLEAYSQKQRGKGTPPAKDRKQVTQKEYYKAFDSWEKVLNARLGAEYCKSCHANEPHGAAGRDGKPGELQCTKCHMPSQHLKDVRVGAHGDQCPVCVGWRVQFEWRPINRKPKKDDSSDLSDKAGKPRAANPGSPAAGAGAKPPQAAPPEADQDDPADSPNDSSAVQLPKKVSDAEYIRDLSLAVSGTLPTVNQTRQFRDDKSLNKRRELLDHWLSNARPAWDAAYQDFVISQMGNKAYQRWRRETSRRSLATELYSLLWFRVVHSKVDSNKSHDERARQLAQFVINLVDALDPDQKASQFNYDPDLTDGWTSDPSVLQSVTGFETQKDTTSPPSLPAEELLDLINSVIAEPNGRDRPDGPSSRNDTKATEGNDVNTVGSGDSEK